MKNSIPLILTSVALNAGAQILMRKGMLKVGEISGGSVLLKALPHILCNVFLWLALLSYGISLIIWMIVLSKVEVSFAYAFLGLGFVLITVIGYFVFNEHITPVRVIGIALVCAGVFFVSQT